MTILKSRSHRHRGRAFAKSSVFHASYGISWAIAAVAAIILIAGAMAAGVWDGPASSSTTSLGRDAVALTADVAPPALWSNAWLGRRSYRSVALHGLRRFATGFVLTGRPGTARAEGLVRLRGQTAIVKRSRGGRTGV